MTKAKVKQRKDNKGRILQKGEPKKNRWDVHIHVC